MEKLTPHYSLSLIRELAKSRKVMTTRSALSGAAAVGMSFDEMLRTLVNLTFADFYKSMTTYADHRIWQDVYRPETSYGSLYLKVTVTEAVLIVSFKER